MEAKLTLLIGAGSYTLTIEEAKELYLTLKGIFELQKCEHNWRKAMRNGLTIDLCDKCWESKE